MNDPPGGSKVHHKRGHTLQCTDCDCGDDPSDLEHLRIKNPQLFWLSPADPTRQAKRLPLRLLKMLTAHSGHLLHPEYLQPLTSTPVSIELDAKKSPLALLAQTCSQIGKPDPPPATKLGSIGTSGLPDKEPPTRPCGPAFKLGEPRPPLEDKSSFKPYSKVGGDSQKEGGVVSNGTDKAGFRLAGAALGGGTPCQSFPPHTVSPISKEGSPPLHPHPSPPQMTPSEPPSADSGGTKKEAEPKLSPEPALVANSTHISSSALAANSAQVRASANASSGSSAASPHSEGKPDPPPVQSGHVAPVSPFKPGPPTSLFPPFSSASGLGYHGSIVGAYAGYPSPFVHSLDHTKSSLVGGNKHPSSSPLTGASPPSFGLCRDPYCLSYPSAPHLGGNGCSTCIHDPTASPLKSGFPLVYPSHPLHSLRPGSSGMGPGLSPHPLYGGFFLPSEPLPHACNWVSAAGPCDKRFSTSEDLLSHLRTHTALPGVDGVKLLSSFPSPAAAHLSSQASPAPLGSSFSLGAPHSLGLARYHPYGKVHLPPSSSLSLPALPSSSPYYSPYALYGPRLSSASTLGYP